MVAQRKRRGGRFFGRRVNLERVPLLPAAAVRWAIREARLRHATVHIIFACRHDGRLRAPYARRSEAPDPVEDDAAARAIFTATAEAARRRLPPGRVKAELTDELPARALVDRTAGAEMLVLGTRQPGRQPAGQPPAASCRGRDPRAHTSGQA